MINKRLLIKNLLAHNDENSFYDKKLRLYISEKEGKAKFLKHVCALSNSNPNNNSYIVIGVKDEDNDIVGVDFFDDSKIQNLVNAYLKNPPVVSYENIPFPHLTPGKVVGLVTVHATDKDICVLKKNIWKYLAGTPFLRDGSISMPKDEVLDLKDVNSKTVAAIENHSQNNIELTLDGVFDFMNSHESYKPAYRVFKEYFVVCWAGKEKHVRGTSYYSRVDIELVNEQVRLFYSEFDEVSIELTEDEFIINEFVSLGYDGTHKYYPFEKVMISFRDNVSYDISTELVFEPPIFPISVIDFLVRKNEVVLHKLIHKELLSSKEKKALNELPTTYLICYLNGVNEALDKLFEAKPLLKAYSDDLYKVYKDTLRVIRKLRYD